jgi:hypothetical protein
MTLALHLDDLRVREERSRMAVVAWTSPRTCRSPGFSRRTQGRINAFSSRCDPSMSQPEDRRWGASEGQRGS